MKNKVVLLWSGGWDGTFRLLQLCQNDIVIQPVYVIDRNRLSLQNELNAMKSILEICRNSFQATILDIQFYELNDIKNNWLREDILEAFKRLHDKYKIGYQYLWFAYLCHELDQNMESSVVHQYHGKVENAIEAEGKLQLIDNDFISGRYIICKEESSSDLNLIFGHLIFPVIKLTKKDEENIARENGWLDIMKLSWFCHTPINGMPCGICGPCDDAMNTGMEWRMPEAAKRRHKFRKFYLAMRLAKRTVRKIFRKV